MSFKNYLLFFLLFGLLGCSTTEEFFDDITAPDYVNSSKAKRLEVPPDLSEIDSSSVYEVPGQAKSYKDFLDKEQQLANQSNNPNRKKVIDNPDGMRIIKSGTLRWLVVEKQPDLLWPHIKDFWEDLGFRVLVANKRTGIIETEWMDTDDIKLDRAKEGALSTFDKWLDSLSGFSDKRKFRTRVEYGEDESTEVYISQRSAEAAADQHAKILSSRQSDFNPSTIYKIEEYKKDGDNQKGEKIDVSAQREIDDYEIDSELLTRLMIKLGATDFEAKEKVAKPIEVTKSELKVSNDDLYIKMNDPYDRSWRRLGLALDIIGFVTEDKNRSEGVYYVRFSQTELPKEQKDEEEGLLDSLIFWDHDKKNDETRNDPIEPNNLDKKNEDDNDENEEVFTGIEAPEVKPLDEDYIPEEYSKDSLNKENEETWISSIWPKWGDEVDDQILPENEKRYRIRIKPSDDGTSIVYLDYSNGKKNLSKDALKVLTIINEYLK